MKKILVALALGIASLTAFAEASFDQIQGLIQQGQYQAAEQGLEVIIKNHPQSAKAFYAMAQAQAGLGNLEKAKKALDIATGLNPTLDFAPASSVASLREAITPQVKKIEAVETSHFWRNFAYVAIFALFGWACYFLWSVYNRKKDEDEGTGPFASGPKTPTPDSPVTPSAKKDVEKEIYASSYTPRAAYQGTPRTVTPAPVAPAPAPTPTPTYSPTPSHTTVVNNNSSNDGLLTGMIIGNMMSNHHETTRVVEREVIRETPSRNSSWDDTPSRSSSSSRDSSWDNDSSSSRSSSWDSDSSSKRSSSWDSDSSSSSSSSWDSGSSSSDSSSSSSWD